MKFRSRIIEKGWDCYARWYDFFQPRMIRVMGFFGELSFEEFQEYVVELANLHEGDRVLDVACGTGASHRMLLHRIGPHGQLVGVDLSDEMLKRAKAKARRFKFERVEYRKAAVEELSAVFEEGSFDAVISINGLPQFLHPDEALVEMVQILKSGGRLAVSTINRDKCERNPFLWPLMKLAPRLWSQKKFRRLLQELGMVRLKFIEEGLMLIMTAQKSSAKERAPSRS
jgi:ubiquinone/menaquinone biosynthesis C-methylase UbiE